jgi:simple sugar transport system ATP-binding protein
VVLAGDNGAGKSTVIKMISGVHVPIEGQVYFDGRQITGYSAESLRSAGIETIYQDLALADNLDPCLNLYPGCEKTRRIFGLPFPDRPEMQRNAVEVLKNLGIGIPDPSAPVRELSGGQRQAIARAIQWEAKLVIRMNPPPPLACPNGARSWPWSSGSRPTGWGSS